MGKGCNALGYCSFACSLGCRMRHDRSEKMAAIHRCLCVVSDLAVFGLRVFYGLDLKVAKSSWRDNEVKR